MLVTKNKTAINCLRDFEKSKFFFIKYRLFAGWITEYLYLTGKNIFLTLILFEKNPEVVKKKFFFDNFYELKMPTFV